MATDRTWRSCLPRCQFRLKTLILATAAIAIWLGWTSEHARRQRAVREALSEVQAALLYDFQFDGEKLRLDQFGRAVELSTLPSYAGLRPLLGDDYFASVVDVRLDGDLHAGISSWQAPYADRIDAALLARLGDLPKLRSLSLANLDVTAEGWAQISQLTRLESLQLGRLGSREPFQSATPFPAELGRLPRLKGIYLGGVPVTDDDLRRIARLPRLESLTLAGIRLSHVSLGNLAAAPKLESLRLVFVGLGADSFAAMSQFHRLKALRLAGNLLGDAELEGIATISSLERLEGGSNKTSAAGWRQLRRLRRLKHLSLGGIDDAGAAALAGCASLETLKISSGRLQASQQQPWASLPQLRVLSVADSAVDDAGLAKLESLAALEELNLDGTKVTDLGLAHLERMTRLRQLSLRRTLVTPGGIAALQRALPNCRIQL